jgi:N-acetylglucosaminyldiphosphoundecaprenol N-acetyl-beta-D-mannosaminyltransferase
MRAADARTIGEPGVRDTFAREVFCLLGLPFDAVDADEAIGRIRRAAASGERCFVATPNVNIALDCMTDAAHRESVLRAQLIVADGMPIVWMSRLLGIPIRERVAGANLFERLRADREQRLAVYFFGGPDGAAEAACRRLSSEQAGLACAGFESPGFGPIESMSTDATIERINASGADFLVVSLGARKGHAWIDRNRDRLLVPVVSHLGAVVNFVAGTVSRAPRWMQRSGLEWLWRIKEEPALWRRYSGEAVRLGVVLVTRVLPCAWHLRTRPPSAADLARAAAEVADAPSAVTIRLRGAWRHDNLGPLREAFATAAGLGKDVALDLREATDVDCAAVGSMLLLQAEQGRRGRRLRIESPSARVRRVVHLCCADRLLDASPR